MSQKIPEVPMTVETKAFLLSIGTADIEDKNLILPVLKSTAGPSAGGNGSVFINSNGHRIRLSIDPDSPIKIKKISNSAGNSMNDSIADSTDLSKIAVYYFENDSTQSNLIVTGEIEPILAHCPEQAYINLSERCIYDCKYCSVPKLQGQTKTKEESLEIIESAFQKGNVKAISITSGVEITPEGELNRVLNLFPELKKFNVPIGVSIYAVSGGSQKLKEAGVSEVKYNIEVADSEIFKQVCPGLSETDVFSELEAAVEIFGKGKVFSNLIIGLGETDESVKTMIEKLAKMGVIACIRPAYENALRKNECFMERPSQERLLKIFFMQKEINEKYCLACETSQTMCSLCTGCDLVPGRD